MKKTIVAIGGYTDIKGKELSFEPISINEEIIKLTGKKSPRILFIPTASNDSKQYCDQFLKMFQDTLKCKTDILYLYDSDLSLKQIENKIIDANAIYVGGGNTLKMMTLWRRHGVDKLLIKAYKKGTVMSGVSAGSICWFNAGVSDSRQFKNPDSNEYIRVTGLGLIPYLNAPHINSNLGDRGYRTKGMKKIIKKTKEVCLVCEDAVAFVFEDENCRVLSDKGKCYKFWIELGNIKSEEIIDHFKYV